ncbi:MAG: hypothetical protein OER80_09520 [Gammaproteobacteria bacterium]|nr:hypothetical protein [Gammaproteobacteria bacterium]MDH3767251.1 hypothetical protein [Gammaproteobacteria bacterium]
MSTHDDSQQRSRVIQWAITLGIIALAVYGTFIYLVSIRGG